MSSSSVIDFVSSSPIINDETSNQSIEIPVPPTLNVTHISINNNNNKNNNPSNNSDDDSDSNDEALPMNITLDWIDEQMRAGVDLRPILSRMLPGLPNDVSQSSLFELLMDLFLPVQQRQPLEQYKTLDDAVELIRKCKNILILTGAGISVSCGIPDFRSRNGIYARLREEFPELPNPQSMFDIEYFTHDPRPFFRFAKEIWPGQYEPSLAHYFIAELERRKQLLRNYTQNIDSLEHLCPIKRLIQCHGSFSTSTCRHCHNRVNSDEIKNEILQQIIPHCTKCSKTINNAILKPDIVFFGEPLPDDFHKTISIDKDKCDLLIVMGSSLKVKPVSLVSELLPAHIPQILINRERLLHKSFDIELLGNCDIIINELCHRLAKYEPSFGHIKRLNHRNDKFMNEILYDKIRTSMQQQKKKKQKISFHTTNDITLPKERLSSLRPRLFKPPIITSSTTSSSSSSSRKRPFSSLKNSPLFNQDLSYISYPPRRYLFAGAEIYFSSSSDDGSDDDLPRKLSNK
ncbi:unnamed protein product [Rotaria sordida]|uniref:protein acetyllysine N-acetyltransferase n=1 Tax=Rotaria sordida TaxID=392033 RepID=A0A814W049_9BILA|nr:unnamed protein product [Rotaria sordida]CAF0941437.1 unnamed protein product [Rotaria sordida]CAF0965457.1 unnamed protein product [Rotaria sordida]CAF1042165.1 unnamed protein product [Rotaria sordida]CAF1195619.1 unnamed protein product [Rotaria sordida]